MLYFKQIVSIASFAMLTACATSEPISQPSKSTLPISNKTKNLYLSPCLQISLQNKNSALKIGYGNGRTISVAKQQALYDIAKQIEVNVSGTETSKAHKINSTINAEFTQDVKSRASQLLTNVEVACSDTNDPSGSYHFALRYDQRPLVNIFSDQLSAQFWQQRPGRIQWQGPSLIIKSPFIKQLTQRLVDKRKTNTANLSVKIFRKNNQWQLIINGVIRTLQQTDYKQLINWQSLNTNNISVRLQNETGKQLSPHLKDGDDFHFLVKTKKNGYLTVFDIYEDGRVTKLRENLRIKNSIKLPEHKGSFSAGLLTPGKSTRDNYIFLITAKKINAQAFHQLQMEKNSTLESNNYSLNIFLQWLDKKMLTGSASLEIETVPR